MRLDYTGTVFKLTDGSCGVIRYTTPEATSVIIPRSVANGGTETSPMPFTGHGFTAGNNGRLGVPEWKSGRLTPDNGSELWEVFSDGTEVLRAKFITEANQFITIP